MEIKIHAKGKHFDETSNLKSIVSILKNYEATYSECLKLASKKYKIIPAELQANIRVKDVSPANSVDIHVLTAIGAGIAPLAPQIFNYAWLLYKSGYDLIGIVTKHFNSTGEPMEIKIENSPGSIVNINHGDQSVTTTMNVFLTASAIQKGLKGFANIITDGLAKNIRISNPDQEKIVFNNDNKNNYTMPSKSYIEDELIELECNIIRFHKKSFNGTLEIYDGEDVISKPFVAAADIIDDCLDAFKAPLVTIVANKEIEINALGETSIIKYHAIQTKIHE